MVSFLLSYHRGLVLTKDYSVVKFHSNAAFHCRVITSQTSQYGAFWYFMLNNAGPRMASGVSSPGLMISLHFSPHQWFMYTNRISEVQFHCSAVFPWGVIRYPTSQSMSIGCSNWNKLGPRMALNVSLKGLMVSLLHSNHRWLVVTHNYSVVNFHSNATFHCRVLTSHNLSMGLFNTIHVCHTNRVPEWRRASHLQDYWSPYSFLPTND